MIEIKAATAIEEGAGVKVRRLMPVAGLRNFDPFVLWDDFTITPGSGFPDHPHRGFEAITYLFNGSIRHQDNLGNDSTVFAGGAQRFTAGRGIVHSEMPAEDAPTRGIQLWINLPQRLKQNEPSYQQVDSNMFPQHKIKGGHCRTLVGDDSPLMLMTDVNYLDIELEENACYQLKIPNGMRGLVYLVDGQATINGQLCNNAAAAFFAQEDNLNISANQNCRLMLCSGIAHGEPIIQHGPFVD